MASMKGVNRFLVARYVVFGLFTICNAITCSVAAWNSGLVRDTQPLQIDIYLIFLGAFSLVSIFTLIFAELLCVNAVTTRVWFECAWVALFWVMELAGGAALIIIESNIPSSRDDTLCTSERVLLAFTWTCAIMLLVYLLALVFIVAFQYQEAQTVWVSDVRTLHAAAFRRCSSSIPKSPSSPRFQKRAIVDVYTAQPLRSPSNQPSRHHKDLSAGYDIGPSRPVFAGSEQMDVPHSSSLPEAIPLPPLAATSIIPSSVHPIPALPKDTGNVRSLSLSHSDPPQKLASSIAYSSSAGLPSRAMQSQSSSLSVPSPIGDWPRRDIMQLPVKPKPPRHAFPLPSASEFPMTTAGASMPAVTSTQPRPRRPSGPRLRMLSVEGGHRPARVELPSTSNYETTGRN